MSGHSVMLILLCMDGQHGACIRSIRSCREKEIGNSWKKYFINSCSILHGGSIRKITTETTSFREVFLEWITLAYLIAAHNSPREVISNNPMEQAGWRC